VVAGLSTGILVAVILAVVLFAGMRGGPIRPGSQQPKVQATDVSILQNIEKSPQEPVYNAPRVSNNATFDFPVTQPGIYSLVFDNRFSLGPSPTKISLSYTAGEKSVNLTMYLPAGAWWGISEDLLVNQRLDGQFTLSGGSPNDIHFSVTAQTCIHTVGFSFTLVNSGTANGNATVHLQGQGTSYWEHAYFVAQGQNLPESGYVFLPDCTAHNYNVNVTSVEKA